MTETQTLIAELERAEEGNHDFNRRIAEHEGLLLHDEFWARVPSTMEKGQFGLAPVPAYTTSIDAALQLVPEGADDWPFWEIKSPNPNCPYLKGYHGGSRAQIWVSGSDVYFGHARAPTLALCIAALKAREAA